MGACVYTGCALDTLFGINDGDESFQITEDVVRTYVDAFAAVFAKVM